jgi:hypothetical protein
MNTNQLQDWVLTDLDTNQYYKQLNETTFLYKEDRVVNPETGDTEVYESEININEYSSEQINQLVSIF